MRISFPVFGPRVSRLLGETSKLGREQRKEVLRRAKERNSLNVETLGSWFYGLKYEETRP
jgi:hypothetical protein